MSGQELFERVLTSLHGAALDDERWPEASGLIDEFCGATGNFLATGDGAAPEDIDIFFARFCFRGQRREEIEKEYFGVYYPIDERMPRMRELPDGRLAPSHSLFSESEMKTSVVHNEFLPRYDAQDGLIARLNGPSGSRIVWSIADPVSGDGWSPAQLETIERLHPHLHHYVRVRDELCRAKALSSSLIELLDNVQTGVIQLDRRGRVVAANDRARALLRKGDGLWDEDGGLRARLPEEDAKLQQRVAQAVPFFGGPGTGGSMLVSRSPSKPQLVVHVSPVPEEGRGGGQGRIGALVLVAEPAWSASLDPNRVRELLGLTPSESRIAVMLAQGMTIDEVVSTTGRGRTTVKWHIKNIYAKHGLSRQVDLVKLVTSLAGPPGGRG